MPKITGYTQDDAADWVALLDCGHTRHFRHNPPWQLRPWALTESGRNAFLGFELDCKECASAAAEPSSQNTADRTPL